MRKILKGPDGWYFNNELIEATQSEIDMWKNKFCGYCNGNGSLFDKQLKEEDRHKFQIPCPFCEGTTLKEKNNHQYIENVKIISVSDLKIDDITYCARKKIIVEFDYCYEAQQDGRPVRFLFLVLLKAYQIGKAIQKAILQHNIKSLNKQI
jgi:excinuclease UvrABC ATPase subunit